MANRTPACAPLHPTQPQSTATDRARTAAPAGLPESLAVVLAYLLEDNGPRRGVHPHCKRLGAEQDPDQTLAEEHLHHLPRRGGTGQEAVNGRRRDDHRHILGTRRLLPGMGNRRLLASFRIGRSPAWCTATPLRSISASRRIWGSCRSDPLSCSKDRSRKTWICPAEREREGLPGSGLGGSREGAATRLRLLRGAGKVQGGERVHQCVASLLAEAEDSNRQQVLGTEHLQERPRAWDRHPTV